VTIDRQLNIHNLVRSTLYLPEGKDARRYLLANIIRPYILPRGWSAPALAPRGASEGAERTRACASCGMALISHRGTETQRVTEECKKRIPSSVFLCASVSLCETTRYLADVPEGQECTRPCASGSIRGDRAHPGLYLLWHGSHFTQRYRGSQRNAKNESPPLCFCVKQCVFC